MVAPDPVIRFRFDFADLKPSAPCALKVVAPALEPMPAGAVASPVAPRPRWLPRMLPVIHACEPLRVAVLEVEATVWASRVRRSLAAVFRCAASDANLSVLVWPHGFAVGPPGFDRIPLEPHAIVVAAELDPLSIGAAIQVGRSLDARRAILALHGDAPKLELRFGLNTAASNAPVHRFPLLDSPDIGAVQSGELRSRFGRAVLTLAQAIVARYREAER